MQTDISSLLSLLLMLLLILLLLSLNKSWVVKDLHKKNKHVSFKLNVSKDRFAVMNLRGADLLPPIKKGSSLLLEVKFACDS